MAMTNMVLPNLFVRELIRKENKMNKRCEHKDGLGYRCGSYAFNLYKEKIEQGNRCDRHYWQEKALSAAAQEREECIKLVHAGTGEPVQTKTLFILQKERKRIADAIREREPLRGCNPSKVLVDEIHAGGNT